MASALLIVPTEANRQKTNKPLLFVFGGFRF
jgi:hypothetical protein